MTGEGLLLFIPNRLNRIHASGFSCREITEANTDKGTYDEADGNAPARNARWEMEEQRGESCDALSEDDA